MARAQKGTAKQTIGRSQGGLSTKIHGVVDALGNPLCRHRTNRLVDDGADSKQSGFCLSYTATLGRRFGGRMDFFRVIPFHRKSQTCSYTPNRALEPLNHCFLLILRYKYFIYKSFKRSRGCIFKRALFQHSNVLCI